MPTFWQSMSLNPALISLGAGLLVLGAIFTWWLMRKRRQRIWLPTLRVIELENRKLPRLRIIPPPWLAFLAFVITSISVALFTLRPAREIMTPLSPDQNRIHIYVDLSPSVASRIEIKPYADKVTAFYNSMRDHGRVTLSTSSDEQFIEPVDAEAVRSHIEKRGFHRPGVKLGESLKHHTQLTGELDRLFIFSDADRYSWDDFNWSYLLEETEIYFEPVTAAKEPATNIFIQQTKFIPLPEAHVNEWEIEVARNTSGDLVSKGVLKVTRLDKELAQANWEIPAGKDRATVRIHWTNVPWDEITGDDESEAPLLWQIESKSHDSLLLDNSFYTYQSGNKHDAVLVAEPTGEMFLEDPVHHLKVALELLSFDVNRIDRVKTGSEPPLHAPLWILVGGMNHGVDAFCPSNYEDARIDALRKGTATKLPLVWLTPFDDPASYQELCQCLARLGVNREKMKTMPTYCEDVENRDQWTGVLSSLGARQVGGELGNVFGAVAWNYKDPKTGVDILAFTVPLRPKLQTGITYSLLPRIVKALAAWQGLVKADLNASREAWPRIGDISGIKAEQREALMANSNVPSGESLLVPLEPHLLPPSWTAGGAGNASGATSKRDEKDPLPWLKILGLVAVIACAFEGLARGGLWIHKMVKRTGALLLLFGLWGGGDIARGEIILNTVGYPGEGMSVSRLAREVANRTSIDLDPMPLRTNEVGPDNLRLPWLWVRSPQMILDSNAKLKTDLQAWLQRGGFLIIENAAQDPRFAAAVTQRFPQLKADEGWRPIPPDHELMRSFHLLEALPVCPGQVWQGFHYDGRLAILAIPFSLLETMQDRPKPASCAGASDYERGTRIFVNLLMVALATDYKKDQIHLPEILKRLR